MGHHLTTFQGSVHDAVRQAILEKIPGAQVEVTGGGGHFTIDVVSPVFAGKSRLESQRLVLGAVKHLMAGEQAPVHAVDTLTTRTPESAG
jgi:acid stress-induced BolA-like protein IbaG/YrbA